jgi:hypothetical protein
LLQTWNKAINKSFIWPPLVKIWKTRGSVYYIQVTDLFCLYSFEEGIFIIWFRLINSPTGQDIYIQKISLFYTCNIFVLFVQFRGRDICNLNSALKLWYNVERHFLWNCTNKTNLLLVYNKLTLSFLKSWPVGVR